MTQNIHAIERPIRIVLGLAMLVGGTFLGLSNPLWFVLAAVGLVPLVTGVMGICPAYSLLGFSTLKEEA